MPKNQSPDLSNPIYQGNQDKDRTLYGGKFVAGIVGQLFDDVQEGRLQFVYVDSKEIRSLQAGATQSIFCAGETSKSYVQNAFYSHTLGNKIFPTADKVLALNKNTAQKADFEKLGFDFVYTWTLSNFTTGAFPTLNYDFLK